MDIVAHGIWSAIAFSGQPPKRARAAVFWGVLPDLIPGTIGLLAVPIVGMNRSGFLAVYPFTHSLVMFATVFVIVAALRRSMPWPMLAWAMHILVDIPGHQRFLTPFAFPLSDFRVMGLWEWLSAPMLVVNYAVMALVVAWLWWRRRTARQLTGRVAALAASRAQRRP